ncbi:MAG: hypothetical protein ACOYON_12140 [Fimbriimonas sp.]
MLLVAAVVLGQTAFVHEPFESYRRENVEGWRVYVSASAQKLPEVKPALEMLRKQLTEIKTIIPTRALGAIKATPFFIEANNPGFPCACYHVSWDWLQENGYIRQKTRSVEIANPKNYVGWIKLNQPYMTLHELAHGYHNTAFSYEDKDITAAYEAAVKSGKYESVKHNMGSMRRAYALTNPMEYFAESTESYFGRNDYFPFDRNDLRAFDPAAYAMIEKAWGIK